MFRFQNPNSNEDPNAHSLNDHQQQTNDKQPEVGESLKDGSDAESIHSLNQSDADEINSEQEERIRAEVSIVTGCNWNSM